MGSESVANAGGTNPATVRHYTVDEIAQLWNVHRETVRRMFAKEQGVVMIRIGKQKANATMRIPKDVMERVYRKMSQGE